MKRGRLELTISHKFFITLFSKYLWSSYLHLLCFPSSSLMLPWSLAQLYRLDRTWCGKEEILTNHPEVLNFSPRVPSPAAARHSKKTARLFNCHSLRLSSPFTKRTGRDIWPRRPCLYHDLKYRIECRLSGPTRTLLLSESFSKASVMVYCILSKIHCLFVHFEKSRHSRPLPLFQRTNWCQCN